MFNSLEDLTFKILNKTSSLDTKFKSEGGKIKMWPAVKQMKEKSYNMGVLAQTNKLVNMHLLTVEQAAMSLNLTVEEYLAEVEKVSDYLKNR